MGLTYNYLRFEMKGRNAKLTVFFFWDLRKSFLDSFVISMLIEEILEKYDEIKSRVLVLNYKIYRSSH